MKLIISFIFILTTKNISAQLFIEHNELLPLKLQYTNKQLKKETDKHNTVYTDLIYKNNNTWDTLPVYLNARGNFRRSTCYFPPLKMTLKKSLTNNTLFKGHKKLKVVLPCLLQKRGNDDVLKEYLAYKIYELIAETHFKTRLAAIEYIDTRGDKAEIHPLATFVPTELKNTALYEGEEAFALKKPKKYILKAIIIEDDKLVAKREGAQLLKRFVHPLNQAETESLNNAFFQFMIGNTDFSTAYQHNQKLIFKEGETIPVPYDFDMSGLVNASYAVVSNIQNTSLNITDVKERMYRGFKRDTAIYYKTRQHFLEQRAAIYSMMDEHKEYFEDPETFDQAKNYIQSFYTILDNETKFKTLIIDAARNE
ncbi:hypothetical protein Q2T41_10400 [Maribacter confluentis]|uniref:YARHG domain-containing protein n=1 Tax=Maribacter confluentis TaxID=1656093 RepID=A0ABT8RQC3_9FLAO|nr:hypothetical protein [Maribacter confluentis]MDO1513066.1 hypothetical protein [Maribacter confluentis]